MKIAIVEDSQFWQEELTGFLRKYEKEKNLQFDISVFSDGLDLMMDFSPVYDLIFFDIEMQYSNGMNIAQKVRKIDDNVVIIFITNMAQYAVKGYEVSALDFIVKPIGYTTFSFKMDKAIQVIRCQGRDKILLTSSGRTCCVTISSIFYIEVSGHCLTVHCVNGDYEVWHTTLKEMEQQLNSHAFAKCSSSHLVNLKYVSEIRGSSVCVGEHEIFISRGKKQSFLNALAAYMGGEA